MRRLNRVMDVERTNTVELNENADALALTTTEKALIMLSSAAPPPNGLLINVLESSGGS
jgi:hypothetical protein